MTDDPLKSLFAPAPSPDENRKKEHLNLAVAAFEAQKSANFKKSEKNSQGMGLLSRLISQITPTRSEDMNTQTKKKFIYGGLAGGLATACVALLILQPEISTLSVKKEAAEPISLAMNEVAPEPLEQAEIASRKAESVQTPSPQVLAQADASSSLAGAPPAAMPMKSMARAKGMPAGAASMVAESYAPMADTEIGRDKFSHTEQNTIKQVKAEPISTFSIDVDTASYSFARSSLDQGVLPQADSVRVEEMVNYFDYAYPAPTSKDEPFKTNVLVKPSPWNEGKQLITIGIKGFDVEKTEQPDSNLVFLLDTSGSMNEPNKLPLLKQSLSMLLDTLKPTDKVSIVVYAGSAGTVLQPTPVSDKGTILNALQNLSAGGSTAGGEGIRLAYQMARANFNDKAINRVILATDGDFNVGITNPDELKGFVERERESGVFLSVLGFGRGNYNDDMMQKLAQNGNGVAAYIDTLNEARKVLVQEAGAALFPIAKDVKIQVEFNPAQVSEYRLVGCETRALNTEDFNNDKVDAGDIGAGAEVTAMYEITPVGAQKMVDDSRYAPKEDAKPTENTSNELAFVKVRYKLPKEDTSKLITTPVLKSTVSSDAVLIRETNWAEAVAGFAQLLKGGKFTGKLTYDDVLKQANENKGDDPFGYRAEFINLVYKAKTAAAMPQQNDGNIGSEPGMPYQPVR